MMRRVFIWLAVFAVTLALLQLEWMRHAVGVLAFCVAAGVLVLAALFLIWRLGPRRYSKSVMLPAHVDAVWPVLRLAPGDDSWMDMVESVAWDAGSNTHAIILYQGGFAARFVQTFDDAAHDLSAVVTMMDGDGQPMGDPMVVNYRAEALPEGTRWTLAMELGTGGSPGFVGWINRLFAPFALGRIVKVARQELARRGAFETFRKPRG